MLSNVENTRKISIASEKIFLNFFRKKIKKIGKRRQEINQIFWAIFPGQRKISNSTNNKQTQCKAG